MSFLLLRKPVDNGKRLDSFSLSFVRVQLFSMTSKLELSIWMHYNNVLENVYEWMDFNEMSAVGFFYFYMWDI